MSDVELIAAYLSTRGVRRIPQGRKTYARRAIVALGEGSDHKLNELRSDQAAGRVNDFGRRIRHAR